MLALGLPSIFEVVILLFLLVAAVILVAFILWIIRKTDD